MAKISLAELKSKFETGDAPTQSDFYDLVDTLDDSNAIPTFSVPKQLPFSKGVINGINCQFIINGSPVTSSSELHLNDKLLRSGIGADYTISGNVIKFEKAPPVGSKLTHTYKEL